MFPIFDARPLARDVKWFRIAAPLVARRHLAGQFVIIRVDETGERIPLTIAAADPQIGTIELIVKAVGKTTTALCRCGAGDAIADVVGPLGRPTEIVRTDHAAVVGGGVGAAVIYPIAGALRAAGDFVSAIVGGRTRELVVLDAELARVADAVFATTDDGSYGFSGTVVEKLAEVLRAAAPPVGVVYAAGPVPMMRAAADLTRAAGVRTIVSLNPIMVDGTGMCGGCRVRVGGETRFACVDGPEFDGHAVDFDELADRLTAYRGQERAALQRWTHACRLDESASARRV